MLTQRSYFLIAAAWLLLALTYAVVARDKIFAMTMPDPDDYLRLQQVRDWLAGQGWFDLVQHRINPPTGGAMHWTRLVDMPLAAVIGVLRPLVGEPGAEMAAAILVPAVTMGVIMALVATIAARLLDRNWAVVAATAAPFSSWIYVAVMPLRVDHHGWQIVAALTLLWALTDEARPHRSGVIAGAAAGLWLNISIEGLPVVASAGALLGVRWLLDRSALPRLQAFLWTLTAGCLVLETATVANAWSGIECDRLSRPYVAALVAMSAGAWLWRNDWASADWRRRAIAAAVTAGAAATMLAWQGPQCLAGPFSKLDPVTKTFWLDNVAESWPLWKRGLGSVVMDLGYVVIGAAGGVFALRASNSAQARRQWTTIVVLGVLAGVLMVAVSRAGGVAHAFAVFGATFIARELFTRARASTKVIYRVFGSTFALVTATPALFLPAIAMDPAFPSEVNNCPGQLKVLKALSPGLIFAPLDVGPEIISVTGHSVVATGHHRNHAAMHDVISAFIGSEGDAHSQVMSHKARYLVVCPAAGELRLYSRKAPGGFAAQLMDGKIPSWLEPLPLGNTPVRAYRVRSGES